MPCGVSAAFSFAPDFFASSCGKTDSETRRGAIPRRGRPLAGCQSAAWTAVRTGASQKLSTSHRLRPQSCRRLLRTHAAEKEMDYNHFGARIHLFSFKQSCSSASAGCLYRWVQSLREDFSLKEICLSGRQSRAQRAAGAITCMFRVIHHGAASPD